jgi:hypothetical protein
MARLHEYQGKAILVANELKVRCGRGCCLRPIIVPLTDIGSKNFSWWQWCSAVFEQRDFYSGMAMMMHDIEAVELRHFIDRRNNSST